MKFVALSLFVIGVARTLLASGSCWINGLEMLGVGGVAATNSLFSLAAWSAVDTGRFLNL